MRYAAVLKANPYHDSHTGEFTSKDGVDVSAWKQVGPQAGSNPGGVFEDPQGVRHYVKFPQKNAEQARAEKLSDDIYRELGIPAKHSQIVKSKGQLGLAGRMLSGGVEIGKEKVNQSPDVKAGYVADAYLGNWDVFGQTYDNILRSGGRDYRVDNGGTLFFRAQGEPKDFSATKVDELQSLIAPGKKGHTAFAGLTPDEIRGQALHLVNALPDEKIAHLIAQAGFTGSRAETYQKALIGRRNVIAGLYAPKQAIDYGKVLKANPYHDVQGKFTSRDFAGHKEIIDQPSSAYTPVKANGKDTEQRFLNKDGTWAPDRQKLHDAIIAYAFRNHQPRIGDRTVMVLGGGPASGKSTIVKRLQPPTDAVHVDVDQIRTMLPEYREKLKAKDITASTFTHNESSQISKAILQKAAAENYNVVLDGTGDTSIESLTKKLTPFKQAGYIFDANYVTVDTETAVQRAEQRGREKGRYVPESFLREVHKNVSKILPLAIKEGLYDHLTLWDTNGKKAIKVATAEGRKLTIVNQSAWDHFLRKAHADNRRVRKDSGGSDVWYGADIAHGRSQSISRSLEAGFGEDQVSWWRRGSAFRNSLARILKGDPYHDEEGKFTSKDKAAVFQWYKTKGGHTLGVDEAGKIVEGGAAKGKMLDFTHLVSGPHPTKQAAQRATSPLFSIANIHAAVSQIMTGPVPAKSSVTPEITKTPLMNIVGPHPAVEAMNKEVEKQVVPLKVLTAAQIAAKEKYNEKALAKDQENYKQQYVNRTVESLDLKATGKNSTAAQKLAPLATIEKAMVAHGIKPEALAILKQDLGKQVDTLAQEHFQKGLQAQVNYLKVAAKNSDFNYKYQTPEWKETQASELARNAAFTEHPGLIKKAGGKQLAYSQAGEIQDAGKFKALQLIAQTKDVLGRAAAVAEAQQWGATKAETEAARSQGDIQKVLLAPLKEFPTKEEALANVIAAGATHNALTHNYMPYSASDEKKKEHDDKLMLLQTRADAAKASFLKAGGAVSELTAQESTIEKKGYELYNQGKKEKQLQAASAGQGVTTAAKNYWQKVFEHGSDSEEAKTAQAELAKTKTEASKYITYQSDISAAEQTGMQEWSDSVKEVKNIAQKNVADAIYTYQYNKLELGEDHPETQTALHAMDHAMQTEKKYYNIAELAMMQNEGLQKAVVQKQYADNVKNILPLGQKITAQYDAEANSFEYVQGTKATKFREVQAEQIKNLTPDEKSAIKSYTADAYSAINKNLGAIAQGASVPSPMLAWSSSNQVKHLDSAMEKVKLGENINLNRTMATQYIVAGLGLTKMPTSQEEANKLVGKVYTENAFSSTSMNPNWSTVFAGAASGAGNKINLKIRAGKDMPGIRVQNVTSQNSSEQEVLLPRGALYVIRKVRYDPENFTKWEMNVDMIGALPKKLV